MAKGKPKSNLFSGGLLATTTVASETTTRPQEENEVLSPQPSITTATAEEEDDPFFGGSKRIRKITQEAEAVAETNAIPRIAIDLLDDNPYQPRRRMNEGRLNALANEIRDYGFKGVLVARQHPDQPNRYQLVFGHRRREAARRAGLLELPVVVDNTISDKEMKAVAVTENVLREDLTPLDEAYAFAAWQEEMSQDAIATRLGVSRGYIRNRLDILKAPVDVQDMVEERHTTMKAVVYLKDVEEEDIRREAIQALLEEQITINQTKAFIENLRKAKEKPVELTPTSEAMPAPPVSSTEVKSEPQQAPASARPVTNQEEAPVKETQPQPKRESVIAQSKEQTEAITDRTKIEAFIKYLQAYNVRLQRRSLTSEERGALDNLLTAVRAIIETH